MALATAAELEQPVHPTFRPLHRDLAEVGGVVVGVRVAALGWHLEHREAVFDGDAVGQFDHRLERDHFERRRFVATALDRSDFLPPGAARHHGRQDHRFVFTAQPAALEPGAFLHPPGGAAGRLAQRDTHLRFPVDEAGDADPALALAAHLVGPRRTRALHEVLGTQSGRFGGRGRCGPSPLREREGRNGQREHEGLHPADSLARWARSQSSGRRLIRSDPPARPAGAHRKSASRAAST